MKKFFIQKVSPIHSFLVIGVIILLLSIYTAFKTGELQGRQERYQEIKREIQLAKKEAIKSKNISHKTRPIYTEINREYLDTDINKLISIKNSDDVHKKKEELIRFIWGENSLPKTISSLSVNNKFYDNRYVSLYEAKLLKRIDHISVEMDYSLQSNIYQFIPHRPNGRLVLFHEGHDGDFILNISLIKSLLKRGYTVAGFCMPLYGLNNKPRVFLPRIGYLKLTSHDHMKFLLPKKGHNIRYFMEPVIRFLNYSSQKYKDISMIGISGGAWTTTLIAAVDNRIKYSFPVAGSYPIFLRSDSPRDWGDYEQTIPELYRICNYLELYIMGSYGTGRRQLQVINRYDSCCFAGIKWKTYYEHIKQLSDDIGEVNWDLYMDESHMTHSISEQTQKIIFSILESRQDY